MSSDLLRDTADILWAEPQTQIQPQAPGTPLGSWGTRHPSASSYVTLITGSN